MLDQIAIGFIETSSIARGIEAADAMCKTAEVRLLKAASIPRGKFVIMISGPVGEVESSLRSGLDLAKETVVAHFIIRNVHQQVLPALERRIKVDRLEAVGVIETKDVAPAIYAADAAAKAAKIQILEIRPGTGNGGKGVVTFTGEVGAVRSAINAGTASVPEGMLISKVVIAMAHEQLLGSLT